MTQHVLKTVEPYFSAVVAGEKTFEARRNDRGFQKGDTLILLDPSNDHAKCGDGCPRWLDGSVRAEVKFVFAGDPNLRDLGGIVPGYVVMAIGLEPHDADPGDTHA